ncbi:MAG: WD40 repeat domain-containing protein [Ktedonobacterales bacterium]
MDQTRDYCLHCGVSQPKSDQICRICGGALEAQNEEHTLPAQPPQPAPLRRRRLITCLVLGGVGLAGIGSCVSALRGLNPPSTKPHKLPIDKHRVLNLPLATELGDCTWLPDNTHLFGCDYTTLFLLDVKSGKKVWVQQRTFTSNQVFWSSDRRYIAEVGDVGSVPYDDFRAVVWDIQGRQQIWKSPPIGHLGNTSYPCALAPSGASFALCQATGAIDDSDSNTTVQIWDIQRNRLIKDWNVQDAPLQGQIGDFAVTTLVWSPDNTRLVVICAGGSVQLWDASKSSRLWTSTISNGRVVSVQWSPDGTTFALWPFNEPMEMLDAHTGKRLFQTAALNFSQYNVNGVSRDIIQASESLVWSSDGTRVAMLVDEQGTAVVRVCDARTGRRLFTCQHVEGRLTGCSWSPNGRYLAAGTIAGGSVADENLGEGSTIQFWDAQSGKALFSYQAPRASGQLAWSPDSHFLATYNVQDYGHRGIHIQFLNFALQVFQVE